MLQNTSQMFHQSVVAFIVVIFVVFSDGYTSAQKGTFPIFLKFAILVHFGASINFGRQIIDCCNSLLSEILAIFSVICLFLFLKCSFVFS